jgi:hypothetical protein
MPYSIDNHPPENRYQDCVFIQIHAGDADQSTSCLGLTIAFGESEQIVDGVRIRFSLQSGVLRLNLTNGELPVARIKLGKRLRGPVKTTNTSSISSNIGSSSSVSFQEGRSTERLEEIVRYQVPSSWYFREIDHEVLHGFWNDGEGGGIPLADLELKGAISIIEACFEHLGVESFVVSLPEVFMTRVRDIKTIFAILSARKTLVKYLNSHLLSQQTIQYTFRL